MPESDRERLFAAARRVGKISGKLHHQADLTPSEMMVFHHVKHRQNGEGVRASELGQRLGISRSGISHLLTTLEEKGLIERVNSRTDRRAVYVRLSACGLERYQSMNAELTACVDRVMLRMGHEQVLQLTVLLNELADIMQEEIEASFAPK
ncbi:MULTISPECIES: MarR family winged helix-turn-helix transcriptional regulator [Caproicibacterium]|uniref:MarR family transcriptional regulator n=1 Tax=Caproicibacterium argilliputei TaxID=3030016 RepID=A0AA97DA84_9FIRM|nr:MarR family transcriptional regulator [Caproicibacterium argilliputei]WOC33161.1 MarR family transcriptional regulator [Caproicibacterium argilliputei]